MKPRTLTLTVLVVVSLGAEQESAVVFEKDVRPIFTKYCSTCHGQSSPKLGLDLRTASSVLRGTNDRAVIMKGAPEESILFQKVSKHEMPPPIYGQTVTDSEIAIIRRWIEIGAPSDNSSDPELKAQQDRFTKEVQPILTSRCVGCHGEKNPMASLALHSLPALLKGSVSGPVVVEGFSSRSVLIRKVTSGAMPPKGAGEPLSPAQIRVLAEWVDRGHFTDPDPQNNSADRPLTPAEAPPITSQQKAFWAFQAPVAASVPKVKMSSRVRTPIDNFLLSKLEANGLSFSADAPALTLLRRAHLDLTGLPPTPEDIATFLADKKPGAYERVLDRLLASPQYGEKWGRHWLDAVGYVDTTHKDLDAARGGLTEGMWRYRDYVVNSLNADKPWSRFLTEQIAGDELVDWRKEKHYTSETLDLITATAYLRNVLDITDEEIANLPVERYEALFKLMEKVSSSTLGLTMQCARCHTHKFDPIPQRDYYRLMAVFMPAYNPSNWLPPKKRDLWTVSAIDKEEIDKFNSQYDAPIKDVKDRIAALKRPYEKKLLEDKLMAVPEDLRDDVRIAFETPRDKRSDIQKFLFERLEKTLRIAPADVQKSLTDQDKTALASLDSQLKELNGRRKKLEKVPALWDVGDAPAVRLLERGSAEAPGPKVTPGFPEVLSWNGRTDAQKSPNAQGQTSGLRLAFAEWLVDRNNPLTARVIVNRIWQHHFGVGLVATPDNFGHTGTAPSNQALLDWLAVDFMDNGWKEKRLHKLIMMSTAYRQNSNQGPQPWLQKAKTVDAGNTLLWRMNLRRLDAESVRDSILAVAGKLDLSMGGVPVQLGMRDDGLQIASPDETEQAKSRRSIYLMARRTYPMSFLAVFDYPIIDANCTRRVPSATPLQALTLMNDEFVLNNARFLASRIETEKSAQSEQIDVAYRMVLGRPATPAEQQSGTRFLEQQTELYTRIDKDKTAAGKHALESFAHALLISNENLYIQ